MRVRRRASRTDHLSRVSALWWTATLFLTSDHLSRVKEVSFDHALIDLHRHCGDLCKSQSLRVRLCRPIFVKLDVEPQAKQNLILIVIRSSCVARNSTNGARNTLCNAPHSAHEDVWSLYTRDGLVMRSLWLCRLWPGALEESARSVPPNSSLVHPLLHITLKCSWSLNIFYNRPSQQEDQSIYQRSSLFKSRIWNEKVVT